jgi:hypothetical protein
VLIGLAVIVIAWVTWWLVRRRAKR